MELREAQHQLNIDLQSSLTLYEYLDEETRKLIFNEEDYVSLSNEILRIQEEINDLTETYNDDILNATNKEAELLTEEYEQQVELKLQEFEVAKANLEVTKKQLALQNTLNERNTRMFINGQWTWVADPDSVAKAREEILEAEYDAETEKLNLDHQKEMNVLNDSIRSFDEKIVDVLLEFVAVYPVGSKVMTNEGEIGLIIHQNKGFPERPTLKVITDKDGKEPEQLLIKDLLEYNHVFIEKVLN